MEWSGVESSGVEWSRVESSGVEWSRVVWSGVEWSGVGWGGVEWSGVEWSGVSVGRSHTNKKPPVKVYLDLPTVQQFCLIITNLAGFMDKKT